MRLIVDRQFGYKYIDPDCSPKSSAALYKEQFYEEDKPNYLASMSDELPYWRAIWGLRIGQMKNALLNGKTVLDIGAGGGFFLDCAHRDGWSVFGIEPSLQAVKYAKKRFDIELFQGCLEEYPETDKMFDAIHLSLVLEHVVDPEAFLRKAMKLLKPQGVFWVEVPNDFNPLQLAIEQQLDKPQWWVVPEHHINYFNFDSLSRLLQGLGFEELDRLSSFPLEMFPLMGLDYLESDAIGAQAHKMRMEFEQNLIAHDPGLLMNLYRNLAKTGIGRTCNFLVKKT